MQDACIEMAKTRGKYENGIVSLQGMQSIVPLSRELLHVDSASGIPSALAYLGVPSVQCMSLTPRCSLGCQLLGLSKTCDWCFLCCFSHAVESAVGDFNGCWPGSIFSRV